MEPPTALPAEISRKECLRETSPAPEMAVCFSSCAAFLTLQHAIASTHPVQFLFSQIFKTDLSKTGLPNPAKCYSLRTYKACFLVSYTLITKHTSSISVIKHLTLSASSMQANWLHWIVRAPGRPLGAEMLTATWVHTVTTSHQPQKAIQPSWILCQYEYSPLPFIY